MILFLAQAVVCSSSLVILEPVSISKDEAIEATQLLTGAYRSPYLAQNYQEGYIRGFVISRLAMKLPDGRLKINVGFLYLGTPTEKAEGQSLVRKLYHEDIEIEPEIESVLQFIDHEKYVFSSEGFFTGDEFFTNSLNMHLNQSIVASNFTDTYLERDGSLFLIFSFKSNLSMDISLIANEKNSFEFSEFTKSRFPGVKLPIIFYNLSTHIPIRDQVSFE